MKKNAVMLIRLPVELKKRIEAEAKMYGVTISDLVRKKLQAVPMTDKPVVRVLDTKRGKPMVRIDMPVSLLELSGKSYEWKKGTKKDAKQAPA